MRCRPLLIAVTVAALALTGCTAASQPVSETAPTPPVAQQPTATPGAQPDNRILTDAKGALTMTAPDPATPFPADRTGLYLFDPATGRPEFWTVTGPKSDTLDDQPAFSLSDDARWVIARTLDKGFLADRTTGTTYQWDRGRSELAAVTPAGFLFEAVKTPGDGKIQWYRYGWGAGTGAITSGTFTLLTTDLKESAPLTLPVRGQFGPLPSLLSPDGKQLALLAGTQLVLIDLTSGTIKPVADGLQADRLTQLTGGKEFVAEPQPGAKTNQALRFDWTGTALKPLVAGKIAPDGSTTLQGEWVGTLTPAVEVLDAQTGQSQFRVLGANLCYGSGSAGARWTADSQAFLVATKEGLRQVALDGNITPATSAPGLHELIPSPVDAARFADITYTNEGSRYHITNTGSITQAFAIQFQNGIEPAMQIPLWHRTGKLLQLSLILRGGHDGPCGDYPMNLLEPKVEMAPYASELKLQVQNTGDCLNVREKPERSGSKLGCFKDGTVLTVAREGGVYGTTTWTDDGQWVRVRMPDGKVGWASLKDGYLGWAK